MRETASFSINAPPRSERCGVACSSAGIDRACQDVATGVRWSGWMCVRGLSFFLIIFHHWCPIDYWRLWYGTPRGTEELSREPVLLF